MNRIEEESAIKKAEQQNPALVELLEFYRQWSRKYPHYEIGIEIGNCGDAEIEGLAVMLDSDEIEEAKRGALPYLRCPLSRYDSIEVSKLSTEKSVAEAKKRIEERIRNGGFNHNILPC